MKNKQSLRLHQAQRQRQVFSPARSRFVETLTKNRQELAVELRSLIAANPFLHTVSDEVLFAQAQPEFDLRADLLNQLHTGRWRFRLDAAEYIIEALDDHGFYDPAQPAPGFQPEEIAAALSGIQQLEPFGIGCRDSLDYIRRQLGLRNEKMALRILDEGAEELSRGQISTLCRKLRLTETELQDQLNVIRSCQLFPCQLGPVENAYVQADVRLTLEDGEFSITPLSPQVLLDVPTGPLSPQLKQYLKEAQLTLDLIDQRNLTMQLVFQCLVRRQRDHLLQDAPLAVCRLKEVAEETGLHLSTVSRACAHKYYEFNGRIRPFSDLLCKALHQISRDRIEAQLKRWIAEEDPAVPLDDEQLALRFQNEGVILSRRRIADVRKRLNIPNSYQRRLVKNTD